MCLLEVYPFRHADGGLARAPIPVSFAPVAVANAAHESHGRGMKNGSQKSQDTWFKAAKCRIFSWSFEENGFWNGKSNGCLSGWWKHVEPIVRSFISELECSLRIRCVIYTCILYIYIYTHIRRYMTVYVCIHNMDFWRCLECWNTLWMRVPTWLPAWHGRPTQGKMVPDPFPSIPFVSHIIHEYSWCMPHVPLYFCISPRPKTCPIPIPDTPLQAAQALPPPPQWRCSAPLALAEAGAPMGQDRSYLTPSTKRPVFWVSKFEVHNFDPQAYTETRLIKSYVLS